MNRPLPSAPHFDVLIIGGGPAGSTAGAWLSKKGCKALICEKEQFPRFHIGESLLPNGNRILKEIGVWEKIENAGFIKKYGAEFTLADRSKGVRNNFSEGLIKGLDQTYQVQRSRFDQILLDHAQSTGCEVRQNCQVTQPTRTSNGWSATLISSKDKTEQTITAIWIIDASGRHCTMGRTLGIKKEPIPYPGRFAVFNHFKGCPRAEGKSGGDIIVLRLKDAWFWSIPISDTITSIGVVAQKGVRAKNKESHEAFFWSKVSESSFLSEALQAASAIDDFRVESDYCFSYKTYGAEQALMAGDAASFIDPVFSSGVYLALESGLLAAKKIDRALKKNHSAINNPKLYSDYTKSMKGRIAVMRKLIEAYYDNDSFEVFMTPKPKFKIPQAINSVLAGCTSPPFAVKWRFWLFQKICAIHKRFKIVPPINWKKPLTEKSEL